MASEPPSLAPTPVAVPGAPLPALSPPSAGDRPITLLSVVWRVLLAEPQPRADPVDKEGSKSPGTGADERGPAAA